MSELEAETCFADLLPVTIGGVTLREAEVGSAHAVLPYATATPEALQEALGMPFPGAGQSVTQGDTRLIWWGREEALLLGRAPGRELSALAAVIDQGDAWCFAELSGAGSEDVLARLVPVDLRAAHFAQGATARSLLGHMHASITRTGPDTFMVAVFRSLAGTLVHDLTQALEAVAARR
ncbi:sarcosine oxidase subunit gamma family protein [Sulfitobacter sp. HNIBRBA3233]|uniref:sarcosine oxidase subunit gamma n=1 Tax=Sulfitobacter marinivivus TaxID=3158558 RepID=UPI0032DF0A42